MSIIHTLRGGFVYYLCKRHFGIARVLLKSYFRLGLELSLFKQICCEHGLTDSVAIFLNVRSSGVPIIRMI